jgi:hypothetical protein
MKILFDQFAALFQGPENKFFSFLFLHHAGQDLTVRKAENRTCKPVPLLRERKQ